MYPPSRRAIRRGRLMKPVREKAVFDRRESRKKNLGKERYLEDESTTLT
jgi:hypothetical protein